MKPEDLRPPFTKDERQIVIHDHVWYLSDPHLAKNKFIFPGWEHADFFGNTNPVCVEYCSGNGAWIAAQAQANPHLNWVAVEKKFMRVRKIWAKIKNLQLKNLIVVCGEALRATQHFFPEKTVSDVYINFPDPWPKNRHAKNRLIQPAFLRELSRVMQPKKVLTFVTDDQAYSDEVIGIFSADADFKSHYEAPYYITDESGYGSSYFDELWRAKGRSIRYHRFVRQ